MLVFASIVYQFIDRKQGWDMYLDSLRSDIDDVQGGTTREGVHLVPMAGASEFCTRIFAGLDISRGALSFNPKLPPSIKHLRFHLEHHSETFEIAITHEHVRISRSEISRRDGPRSPSIPVFVEGFMRILDPKSESLVVELKAKRLGEPLQCSVCATTLQPDSHYTCRRCGRTFCAEHFVSDPKWLSLPAHFNIDPVRVCNDCFAAAMKHNFQDSADWWTEVLAHQESAN